MLIATHGFFSTYYKGGDFHFTLFDQGFLGRTKHSLIKNVPCNCSMTSYFIFIKGGGEIFFVYSKKSMFPLIMRLGEQSCKWMMTENLKFNFLCICFRDCLAISMARQVNIEVNVFAFFFKSNQTFIISNYMYLSNKRGR